MDQRHVQYYRDLIAKNPDKKDLILDGAYALYSSGNQFDSPPDLETITNYGKQYQADQPFEITKGLKSKTQSMQGFLHGAVGLAGDMVGSDTIRDYGYEGYKRNMAEAQEVAPRVGRVEDINSIGDASDWLMGTIGGLGPDFGEMLATTFIGGMAGSAIPGAGTTAGAIVGATSRKAIREVIEGAIEKQIGKKIASGIEREVAEKVVREEAESLITREIKKAAGKKAGLVLGVAPLEAGGMYGKDADERGIGNANPWSAAVLGTASAMTESSGAVGDLATNGLKRPTKSEAVKSYLSDSFGEAGQELVQTGLGDVNRLVNNPDAQISGSEYLNAGAGGFVGGSAAHLPSLGLSMARKDPKAPQDIIKSARGETGAPIKESPVGDGTIAEQEVAVLNKPGPIINSNPTETMGLKAPGATVPEATPFTKGLATGGIAPQSEIETPAWVDDQTAPITGKGVGLVVPSVQPMPVEERPAVNAGLQIAPEPEPIQEPDIFNARAEATLDDGIKYTYGENKAGKPSIFAHDQTGKLLDAVTYKNHEIASSEFVKLTEPVQEALPVEQPIVPAMGLKAMPKTETKNPSVPAKGLSLDQDEFGGMGLPVYESKGVINESEKTKEEKASIALPDKKKTEAPEGVNVTSVDGMSYNDIDNLHASQRKTVESLINDKPFKAKKKIRETLKALQENQKRAVAFVSYTNKNQSGSYNKGKNNGLQGFIESIEGRKLNEFFQKLSDGVFDVENNNAKVSIEQKSEAVPFKAPEGVKLTSTGGPFKISGAKKAAARHTKSTGEAAEIVPLGGSNYGWRVKYGADNRNSGDLSGDSIRGENGEIGTVKEIRQEVQPNDKPNQPERRTDDKESDGRLPELNSETQPKNSSQNKDTIPKSKSVVINKTPVDAPQTDLTLKDSTENSVRPAENSASEQKEPPISKTETTEQKADQPSVETVTEPVEAESSKPKISPEQAIKISADDIESLRKPDVFRVLDTYSDNAKEIAEYIKSKRPELSAEVDDSMEELGLADNEIEISESPSGKKDIRVDMSKKEADSLKPKEQKEYLLKEIDTAIENAPDVYVYTSKIDNAKEALEGYKRNKEEIGVVEIHVPGDGSYSILNAKSSLKDFKDRASKFPASELRPVNKSRVSIPRPKRPEGFEGEYVKDPYKPYSKTLEIKKGDKKWFKQDGYSSNGGIIIKGDVKGTPSIERDPGSVKRIIDSLVIGKKAEDITEHYDSNGYHSSFIFVEAGGDQGIFNSDYFDAVLTRYKNADIFLGKAGPYESAIFKDGDEVVAVIAGLKPFSGDETTLGTIEEATKKRDSFRNSRNSKQADGEKGRADDKKRDVNEKDKDKPISEGGAKTITDVGEKLGGARKDTSSSGLGKKYTDDEIKTQPFSKIWPKPDLKDLDNTIESAFIYAARKEVPTKPRKGYKLASWIKQVQFLRDFSNEVQEGRFTKEGFEKPLMDSKPLREFYGRVKLYQLIDKSLWDKINHISDQPDAYTYDGKTGSKTPSPVAYVNNKSFQYKKSVSEVIPEIEKHLSESSGTTSKNLFEVRGTTKKGYSINRTGDPEYRPLKTFETSKEAFDYIKTNKEELDQAWEDVKARDNVHQTDVRRKENRPRVSEDYRKGKDVSGEEFMNKFGFRGVEFGNWVKQGKNDKERQAMVNSAYDALMDLSKILGIPPEAISLNGELGLGFGSRGHGAASAHYEPDGAIINLTKPNGAGALAHEWFHALDNYFQKKRGAGGTRETSYLSYEPEASYRHKSGMTLRGDVFNSQGMRFKKEDWTRVEGVRPEVESKWADVVGQINKSDMSSRSARIDNGKTNGYWSRIIEKAARSFENYVVSKMKDDGYHNDYLANVATSDEFVKDDSRYPYLMDSEMGPIKNAFDSLFAEIKTRKTDKGTELYSKSTPTGPTATISELSKPQRAEVEKLQKAGKVTMATEQEAIEALKQAGLSAERAKYMVAYHGTPHDFDQFSMEYLGTGEGVQAYGHGLYFAGNKEVAEYYKRYLSAGSLPTFYKNGVKITEEEALKAYFKIGRIVDGFGYKDKVLDFEAETNDWRGWRVQVVMVDNAGIPLKYNNPPRWHSTRPDPKEVAKALNADGEGITAVSSGRLYQVELAPKEDEYLLWDGLIDEQGDKIKSLLEKTEYWEYAEDRLWGKADRSGTNPIGRDLYRDLLEDYSPREASEFLKSIGIRGIKYLDGSSRGKGEGNYNYVIFDDADVKITAKYSKDGKIQGFVLPNGKAYIIPSNIKQGKLWNVIRHEIGVHMGQLMQGLPEFNRILKTLENLKNSDTKQGELVRKAFDRVPKDTKPEHIAEEALAYLVESAPEIGIVRRFITMVKRLLVKMGVSPMIFNQADYAALADAAIRKEADRVPVAGETMGGVGQFAQDARMSIEKAKMAIQNLPAFKKWFGDSKVVNEDGGPLVVYHGTDKDFSIFDTSHLQNKSGHAGSNLGFFFSSKKVANKFTGYSGGRLVPVYLKMENPLVIDANEFHEMLFGEEKRSEHIDKLLSDLEGEYGESLFIENDTVYRTSDETGQEEYIDGDKLTEQGMSILEELSEVLNQDPRDFNYSLSVEEFKEIKKDAIDDGHDGIIIDSENYNGGAQELYDNNYIIFDSKQIKSIFNTKWNPENPDIMMSKRQISEPLYSISDAKDHITEAFDDALEFSKDLYERKGEILSGAKATYKYRKDKGKNFKEDTTWIEKSFGLVSHYAKKIPAFARTFNAALRNSELKTMIEQHLTHGVDEDGKPERFIETINNFRRKFKSQYRKLDRYLHDRDLNQVGYRVKTVDPDQIAEFGGKYIIVDLEGKDTRHIFESKREAFEKITDLEVEDYINDGNSQESARALRLFRTINNRSFDMRIARLEEIEKFCEENGIRLPDEVIVEGEKIKVDLKAALIKMGDRRGYYMPRIRNKGEWVVYALKDCENPRTEYFDMKLRADFRRGQLENNGYRVTVKKAGNLSEDLFEQLGSVLSQQAIINESMEEINKGNKIVTLKDLDIKSWMDGDDLVMSGEFMDEYLPTLDKFEGEKKVKESYIGKSKVVTIEYRFKNAKKGLEEEISKELFKISGATNMFQEVATRFAKAFVSKYADVIRSRGSRSAMIGRSDKVGQEVNLGFEEDALTRVVRATLSLAGGEAKSRTALSMIETISGRDVSWSKFSEIKRFKGTFEEFEKQVIDNDEQYIDRATFEEIKNNWVGAPQYPDYIEFVEGRGIDPALQKTAHAEAMALFKDMMRNDERADRVIGTLKGLAVLKYLGFRVAAPVVNMTNMVVGVPGAMAGYGKIPIRQAMKHIAKSFTEYRQFKKGELKNNTLKKVFEEIEKRGWDQAQFNHEGMAALQNKMQFGYAKIIETSMMMFTWSEKQNRVATISAAFKGLQTSFPDLTFEERLLKAKEISDKAHGIYEKANRPSVVRGGSVGANILQMGYVFKTFTHNFLATMADLAINERDAKAVAWLLFSPAMFGLGASMGASWITSAIGSALGSDDPEEDLYKWVESTFGSYTENLARFGVFGALGDGISVKGSLSSVGVSDLPTSFKDLIGAPGSVVTDVIEGVGQLGRGNVMKGAESILPLALGAPVKAYREYTEGITTKSNAPVFFEGKPLKADAIDAFLRFWSFNPSRIAGAREKLWGEKVSEQAFMERRKDIYSRVKKYYLDTDRNPEDLHDIEIDIAAYNQRAKNSGQTVIKAKNIKSILKRAKIEE